MSKITISNLNFNYENSCDSIFENVSFIIDTDWKLGFIGRNGRGKTTFLRLLMGEYAYNGKISSAVGFTYFPFDVSNKSKSVIKVVSEIYSDFQQWEFQREISLLNLDDEILQKSFETLSNGQQTKILLAILFLKENNFLLIDEPTNHLDAESRDIVSKYLQSKKGFILVSHDRAFLDSCIDHVLSINRTNIEVQQGNFTSWWLNKKYQDDFEFTESEKLKKDIRHLEKSAKQTRDWGDKIEASKYGGKRDSGLKPDRGFIGHKAAKMMKRSISAQNRKEKLVSDKSKLLKNLETAENLKLNPLIYRRNKLVGISNLSVFYDDIRVCENVNFDIKIGDRIHLHGKNGCGKSSVLKLILNKQIKYSGDLNIANDLKISYIPQDTSYLKGDLTGFSKINNLDECLFKTILRKLNFQRTQFDKNIEDFSSGQKKKVLIAKSLCEQTHLYIWDEPLNFIDILSRIQIEDLILKYMPTMIFVEHDKTFSEKIRTKEIKL
ncbi:MAG: Lsa family ABC-F type ribosomal protection protein [Candidatus Improbicoccus devescovinae]|nr:MAG: Lsa family ABC-F type ribosomal protection protein [Candidatus Improbicoccus devescovinae]